MSDNGAAHAVHATKDMSGVHILPFEVLPRRWAEYTL